MTQFMTPRTDGRDEPGTDRRKTEARPTAEPPMLRSGAAVKNPEAGTMAVPPYPTRSAEPVGGDPVPESVPAVLRRSAENGELIENKHEAAAAPLQLLSRNNAPVGLSPDSQTAQGGADVIRRYDEYRGRKWSQNLQYVTGGASTLGIADGATKPALPGATWNKVGAVKRESRTVPTYRPVWSESSSGRSGKRPEPVEVPKDCITTAELVSAWLTENHPEEIGEIPTEPTITPFDGRGAKLQPGSVLFHVHDPKDAGQYHGAPVIASDGEDVVTMESDRSDGPITSTAPLFDMYRGREDFERSQNPNGLESNRSQALESTYVISFSKTKHRSETTTLWKSLQDAFGDDELWSGSGKETAERIINAIPKRPTPSPESSGPARKKRRASSYEKK